MPPRLLLTVPLAMLMSVSAKSPPLATWKMWIA